MDNAFSLWAEKVYQNLAAFAARLRLHQRKENNLRMISSQIGELI